MKRKRDILVSILFLAPAMILLLGLIIYPVVNTVNLSVRSWNGVLSNRNFWEALLHCVYFLVGGFCILMPLAFILALIITSKMRGRKLFKTAFFMPIMLSATAVALIWVYMLNPKYGFKVHRAGKSGKRLACYPDCKCMECGIG